ncbi:hypothetical protein AKJ16_DCAP22401 [Drosera capensis]
MRRSYAFDAIVFATGFRRSTMKWIQEGDYLFNDEGLPNVIYYGLVLCGTFEKWNIWSDI